MTRFSDFELTDFTPYLLNQAADATSRRFQKSYKSKYGMLRTEWRVLFHLGCYGDMTAKEICTRAGIHKTKISRAVNALSQKRYLTRSELPEDRRHELLSLTKQGKAVFQDLLGEAKRFDAQLAEAFVEQELALFRSVLARLAQL